MEWDINRTDNENKVPGILYGRYPGDSYAGGNPWQLLTAVLAETFYLASQDMLEQSRVQGDFFLSNADHKEWKELLQLGEGSTASDFVTNAKAAGDSVMTRLYSHIKDDGGRIDEQIDRETGVQKSAKTLTWSHANVLHALHIRNKLVSAMEQPLEFIQ
jgi:glucoamylase